MTTYKVTFQSMMNGSEVKELFYGSDFQAVVFCRNTCTLLNLDNWDGSEGGGVGYDYRITLETIY